MIFNSCIEICSKYTIILISEVSIDREKSQLEGVCPEKSQVMDLFVMSTTDTW